jgi:capsular polysaccharide biosynthesis protein
MIIKVVDEKATLADAEKLATATASFLSPKTDFIYQIVKTGFNASGPKQTVSVKELKESLSVTVDSMMINLEYESTNVEADTILNTIIVEFRKFIDQTDANEPIKKVEVDGEMIEKPNYIYDTFGGKLQVLSYASDPTNDSKLLVFKYMALFFIIGAIGTVLAVLLKVMLNDTYSDKETLQNDIGIDVLVMIEDVISVKKESK